MCNYASLFTLSREEAKDLARRNVLLTGFDNACVEHTILWQRKIDGAMTNPTANENGVSGYCILDGVPQRRVHICAHDPCGARHVDAHGNVAIKKYGEMGPPDHHVRIYLPDRVHLGTVAALPSPPPMPPPSHDPPPDPPLQAAAASSAPSASSHLAVRAVSCDDDTLVPIHQTMGKLICSPCSTNSYPVCQSAS